MYLENTIGADIPALPMEVEKIEKLPPTFIVGAGKDKLPRSSKIWAENISKRFKEVQFKIYEGEAQGFFSFGKGSEELGNERLSFFEKSN